MNDLMKIKQNTYQYVINEEKKEKIEIFKGL